MLMASPPTDPPDEDDNPTRDGPILITHEGETHTLWDWGKIKGISYQTLYQRIYTLKWPIEAALTKRRRYPIPPPKRTKPVRVVVAGEGETFTHNGKTLTIIEWGKVLGIPPDTIRRRIKDLGWPLEDALKPIRRPSHASRTLHWMTAETPDGPVTKPMSQWSAELGIPMSTISRRLARGWSDTQALNFAPSPMDQRRLDALAKAETPPQDEDTDPFKILDFPEEG